MTEWGKALARYSDVQCSGGREVSGRAGGPLPRLAAPPVPAAGGPAGRELQRTHTHGKALKGAQHQSLFLGLVIAPRRKAVHRADFFFLPLLPSPQSISGTGF